MNRYIKVIARTPNGDTSDYMFMGDIDRRNEEIRFVNFMMKCADDCADRFCAPEDWNVQDWFSQTKVSYEIME